MKDSFFITHFGLVVGSVCLAIDYTLGYYVWPTLIYNPITPELNLILVFAIVIAVAELTKKYYAIRRNQLLLLYTLSVFLILSFSSTLFISWVMNSNAPSLKDHGFFLVLLLLVPFLFCLAWGLAFDRIKNKYHEQITLKEKK